VLALFRSLQRNRRLLTDLVGRDLRGRYVGSSMGFFWSVIFPVVNLVVYMFVFSVVLNARWDANQPKEVTALLMLSGIVVWQAFAESVSRMTNTLVENQNLIQKVVFPSEVLPPYLVLSSLINMLIGIAITLLGVVWCVYVRPVAYDAAAPPAHVLGLSWSLCSLPVLMLLQAVFTLGLGYFFAALNLFLRDIYHVMGVALQVWMFLTPIFYPPAKVVESGMTWVLKINPMYWLVDSYRNALLWGLWPKLPVLLQFGAVALLLFLGGSLFFLRQKPRFPDLL
jgi:lipopolysaccharide transport system permease protein